MYNDEMFKVLNIIEEIKNTSSKNDKQLILERNKDNELLKEVLYFVFNDFIVTGISDKKLNKNVSTLGLSFDNLMDYLKENNTGSDIDIASVQAYIDNQPKELRELCRQIATKDLKIGVSAKSLNKVYGKNFIPEFSCMLAKKYDDHKNKVKSYFIISKKLDGSRLIIIKENGKVKSFTRTGKPYIGLNDIEQDIAKLKNDNIVLDGELIANIKGSTVEVFSETIKKSRTKELNKTGLIFNIFDMIPLEEFKNGKSIKNAVDRKNQLSEMFIANKNVLKHCVEVEPLYMGNDLSKIDEFRQYALGQEWEGIMINLDKPYVCKRTDYLLKVKGFNDADVRVIDIIEGTGKYTGMLGAITIQFEHEYKKYECNCGTGFSDHERKLYFKQPELLIGKIVTIGYFEVSKNVEGGFGLRFPSWKGVIRHDKDEISMY